MDKIKYSNFNKAFLLLVCLITLCISVFNYFVDPFYIYKTKLINNFNIKKSQIKQQERITKIFEFKLDKNKYDAIFIGSSKVDFALSPSYYEKLTKNKAKNLALVGASIEEEIDIAKWAIDLHPEIKKIYLGLDFFVFSELYKSNYTPLCKNIRLNDFFVTLLSYDATKASIETILANTDKNFKQQYDNDGLLIKTFENLPERFEETIKEFYKHQYKGYKLSQKKIEKVREFSAVCKQKDIDLVLFISPIHAALLQTIKEADAFDSYKQWKKELVSISPIYDFSFPDGINSEKISKEMLYYVDAAHVVKEIGNKEIDKLVLNKGNFGKLITIENINKYNKKTEISLKKWEKNESDWVRKIRELKETDVI